MEWLCNGSRLLKNFLACHERVKRVEWNTLYQVKTCLIEMECANFLKIVDLW